MELWKLIAIGLSVFTVVAFGLTFIRNALKLAGGPERVPPSPMWPTKEQQAASLTIRAEATIRVGDLVSIRRDPTTNRIYARPSRAELDIEKLIDRPATDHEQTVVARPPPQPAFRPPPLRVPVFDDLTVGLRGLVEGERVRVVEVDGVRKVVPAVDGGEKKVVRVKEEDGRRGRIPRGYICETCADLGTGAGRCPCGGRFVRC